VQGLWQRPIPHTRFGRTDTVVLGQTDPRIDVLLQTGRRLRRGCNTDTIASSTNKCRHPPALPTARQDRQLRHLLGEAGVRMDRSHLLSRVWMLGSHQA